MTKRDTSGRLLCEQPGCEGLATHGVGISARVYCGAHAPAAHSPLPWVVGGQWPQACIVYSECAPIVCCDTLEGRNWDRPPRAAGAKANAALIVQSVNERPALLSRLAAQEAEIARLRAALGEIAAAARKRGVGLPERLASIEVTARREGGK